MLNPTPDAGINSIFETTSQMDVPAPTTVASLTLSAPTLTPSAILTISTVPQAPTPPTTALSTLLQDLLNFGSLFGFDHRLKTLKANFSEFVQINQCAKAVFSIPGIVQRYIDQRMNEAVKVAVQILFDKLRDEAEAKNEEFLKNLDENIQKIIKEQVKEQVKVQVSKILSKIEKTINEQLEAKVLTRSSNSSKTSYAALVEAYKSDKIILETYGDIVTLKRRRDDDADKDEEPSAGSDRGSKRRREGKEPESTSAPKEKATRTTGKSAQGSKSQQKTASESAPAEDDDKLYKFKEGDFKRLRIQDIEDMLLLLVQGKLKNLTVEERFAFNVSLRMFTRSIVIQRRVEDLQLGVESYQKKLNLTKPDTYHSDLKRKEAYTTYTNPRGFIYQNKNKQNRLMWIDELHKFINWTLNDVRTALDDRLKGIWMKYLPQTIWRKSEKERAAAMIQAINKQLKTRRIMRSLKKFVGGRLYEGDFRMLQRTI
uniref:Uncharacterized protein n=1 Tax=Tanacetum cinerariifolium TaxID=118510 RepID=A0A6L2M1V2_TANCI|nr:hypothetical protein [Tanacetum cinerariifolium]